MDFNLHSNGFTAFFIINAFYKLNFQAFYKIMDARNKELDPETGYKVAKLFSNKSQYFFVEKIIFRCIEKIFDL